MLFCAAPPFVRAVVGFQVAIDGDDRPKRSGAKTDEPIRRTAELTPLNRARAAAMVDLAQSHQSFALLNKLLESGRVRADTAPSGKRGDAYYAGDDSDDRGPEDELPEVLVYSPDQPKHRRAQSGSGAAASGEGPKKRKSSKKGKKKEPDWAHHPFAQPKEALMCLDGGRYDEPVRDLAELTNTK